MTRRDSTSAQLVQEEEVAKIPSTLKVISGLSSLGHLTSSLGSDIGGKTT